MTDAQIISLEAHRPPAFTDEALALRFAAQYANRLRYVAVSGRWFIFSGKQWSMDDTLQAFDLSRSVCRQASTESNAKVAPALASAKTVSAVERLAKADRRLAATMNQWDNDPMALNTPDGVIDLRTGARRPHAPEDYMTRITAVGPGRGCPTWLKFLQRVTGGDGELIRYLQRVAGYALTGSTEAHALFFAYGLGANGKSVFINTIAGVLHEYHRTSPIETFTASSTDRHPTELAGLQGARLVTSIETEEGRRWAESRIKSLTGGDKIAARFMRQDFFEFSPQFKLIIAGNHKPGLRSVDEAIRRRFNLIPFSIQIPPEERDTTLPDRLKTEWPGILKWMIDGCLEWQRQGLAPPVAVTTATEQYLEGEDALTAWLDEKCQRSPHSRSSSTDLFVSWKVWAEGAGEYAGSQRQFSQRLEDKGFVKEKTRHGREFLGLRVVQGGWAT